MDKKIAFITFGHWGSTIPLAKHFCNKGFCVDYYIECFRNSVENLEATDTNVYKFVGFEGAIPNTHLGSLKEYCEDINYRFLRLVSPLVNHPYLSYITRVINCILIFFMSWRLNKRKYDYVILVGRHTATHFVYYHKFINTTILTCLHEVCDRDTPDYNRPNFLLKYLFRKRKKIVVHSQNTLNKILKYPNCNSNTIYKINFGLFETWRYCSRTQELEALLGDDYILFIGGIDDYKGLDVLCKTIKLLRSKGSNTEFVIAGRGHATCMDELSKITGVTIINRFLTNKEFATLVYHSHAVICPYKRMSQSGIPQSVFVFTKPVIASDLKGFEEIVKDTVSGIICKSEDIASFADAIISIYKLETYKTLKTNLFHFEDIFPEMNWENITQNYIDILNV